MAWGSSTQAGASDLIANVRSGRVANVCVLPSRALSGEDAESLFAAVAAANGSVEEVVVSGRHALPKAALRALGRAVRRGGGRLRSVSVGGEDNFGGSGLASFCEGFQEEQEGCVGGGGSDGQGGLERLDLERRGLEGEAAGATIASGVLASGMMAQDGRACLLLGDNPSLGDSGCLAIVARNLQSGPGGGIAALGFLDLHGTGCGDAAAEAIAAAMTAPGGKLRELNLGNNEAISARGASAIAKALASDACALTKLTLNGCTGIGCDGLAAIAEGASSAACSLDELNVRSIGAKARGVLRLVELMENGGAADFASLKTIDVSENEVGDETAARILTLAASTQAAAGADTTDAEECCRLTSIGLFGASIGDGAMRAFVCSVRDSVAAGGDRRGHCPLQEIDFGGNGITSTAAVELLNLLLDIPAALPKLRHLVFGGNPCTKVATDDDDDDDDNNNKKNKDNGEGSAEREPSAFERLVRELGTSRSHLHIAWRV